MRRLHFFHAHCTTFYCPCPLNGYSLVFSSLWKHQRWRRTDLNALQRLQTVHVLPMMINTLGKVLVYSFDVCDHILSYPIPFHSGTSAILSILFYFLSFWCCMRHIPAQGKQKISSPMKTSVCFLVCWKWSIFHSIPINHFFPNRIAHIISHGCYLLDLWDVRYFKTNETELHMHRLRRTGASPESKYYCFSIVGESEYQHWEYERNISQVVFYLQS